MTLDHGTNQNIDDDNNDNDNNDNNGDEAISNIIVASHPNRQAECVPLKYSMKMCKKENLEQESADGRA